MRRTGINVESIILDQNLSDIIHISQYTKNNRASAQTKLRRAIKDFLNRSKREVLLYLPSTAAELGLSPNLRKTIISKNLIYVFCKKCTRMKLRCKEVCDNKFFCTFLVLTFTLRLTSNFRLSCGGFTRFKL